MFSGKQDLLTQLQLVVLCSILRKERRKSYMKSKNEYYGYALHYGNPTQVQTHHNEASIVMKILSFMHGGSDIHELRRRK